MTWSTSSVTQPVYGNVLPHSCQHQHVGPTSKPYQSIFILSLMPAKFIFIWWVYSTYFTQPTFVPSLLFNIVTNKNIICQRRSICICWRRLNFHMILFTLLRLVKLRMTGHGKPTMLVFNEINNYNSDFLKMWTISTLDDM